MRLSPHFQLAELTRSSTGLDNSPDALTRNRLRALCAGVLEPIRAILGVPLHVNSGYRSLAVNHAIGGAAGSQHLKGEAADIVPTGYPGGAEAAMVKLAAKVASGELPADQLIIYSSGFVHVSHRADGKNRGEVLRSLARGGSSGPYVDYMGPV